MPAIDLTPPLICDPITLPALPTVPTGVSFGVELPGFAEVFSARLCCKIFQLPIALPPVDLGISVSAPILIALDQLIGVINSYRSLLPMACARE